MELLVTQNKALYLLASLYYRLMVKKEVELAGINQDDKVLCIGGGCCPYTAILIRKYTNARVTVIDNDCACIDKSKAFLQGLGLDGIEIRLCDGKHIGCRDYSVIHVAMQVSPKEAVINEIFGGAPKGARVLVRNPKTAMEKLYSRISKGKERFSRSVKHGFFSNVGDTSVCIVGENQAEHAEHLDYNSMVAV